MMDQVASGWSFRKVMALGIWPEEARPAHTITSKTRVEALHSCCFPAARARSGNQPPHDGAFPSHVRRSVQLRCKLELAPVRSCAHDQITSFSPKADRMEEHMVVYRIWL